MNHRLMIRKYLAKSLLIVLTLFSRLPIAAPAAAQRNNVASGGDLSAAPASGQGPTDRAELEAFLDEFFVDVMEQRHIAGAAVAIVKDGELFFTKGYGYSDIEHGIPVDPEETMFHIGSNTKPITWTAVMQLVEQGKLDLDADVNTYLDFRVPDTYPQPITLRSLMTHSSGFAERWIGSLVVDESELMPTRDWLVSKMPARIFPPGEAVGYSNYNAMLAGYIVSRVSGQPYPQYIQEHIFDPLGMSHSTAISPIPPELRAKLSGGYVYVDGAFQPFPDYTGQQAGFPSGVIQATVTDMARFMIAQLEYGRYSDEEISEARILKESTARQMQTTLYTPDPRFLGTAYAYAELTDNGVWTLGHEGYYPPMRSQTLLLPDRRLGIFYAVNTRDTEDLTIQHYGFQRAFFDHYFPAPAAEHIEPPTDFAERAARFVGSYRMASYPASTPDKVADVVGGYSVKISAPGDDTLLFDMGTVKLNFVEVEPLYFRQVNGPFSLLFTEDDRGRITQLYTDLQPQYAAMKLPWYELPSFHLPLTLTSVLLFLITLPVALAQSIRERHHGADTRPASRAARSIIAAISLLNLLFVGGMLFGFRPATELHGIAPFISLVVGLTVLSALLTALAVVYMVLAWKGRYWSVTSRTYYTLVTVAAITFVWFLNHWNLLGWRY